MARKAKASGQVRSEGEVVMECSLCNGGLEVLGALGNRMHLRCRGCGMLFSRRGGSSAWAPSACDACP